MQKKFRRLKRFEEDEDEDTDRPEEDREAIANELFEGESNDVSRRFPFLAPLLTI